MDQRTLELQECRREVQELTRRVNALSARIDRLEGAGVTRTAVPAVTPPVKPVPVPAAPEPPRQKDRGQLENAVGRNLFAVLASLLVLLGVGVFISTIYEYIPQTVKILAIYLFGFALLGSGLALYRSKKNKFWLGVASCGLAELLVSVITSHTYFGVLPLAAAFGLILVWILGSLWLTRFHPTVFKTIGYIGFLISVALGLDLLENHDVPIYMTLLGAYVVLSLFFMLSNREFVKMNTAMAFGSAAGLWLFLNMPSYLPENLDWVSGGVALAALGLFNGVYLLGAKLHRGSYPFFGMVTVLALVPFLAFYDLTETLPLQMGVIFLLWYLGHWAEGYSVARISYAVFAGLYLYVLSLFCLGKGWEAYGWYGAFALVAYGLYYFTGRRSVAWMGLACFLGFWIFAGGEVLGLRLLSMGIAAGMLALNSIGIPRKDTALETAWYALLFSMIYSLYSDVCWALQETGMEFLEARELAEAAVYASMAVANTGYLHLRTRDREQVMRIKGWDVVVLALQGYLFMECMNAVGSREWFPTLLGVAASMLILSHSLWYTFKTRGQSKRLMVWQFVKFSLYCWWVLAILDSPSILVHISLLLIAIVAIGVGFRLGHRAVRVYGLILSLLDVALLVLFNIDYSNSLQFAGGIVLCGGLCFVISFIYSRISKAQISSRMEETQ